MSNVSNFRCPLTPGLPAIVISAGLVFCETKEWNHGAVMRAVNQHQSEPKRTKTDQPTEEEKKITKRPNEQPINSPTSKYINQLLQHNKATNELGINILLVCYFRMKQSILYTIK